MCTLTVFKHSHGFLVTMNRDERRGRQEPGRLQQVVEPDGKLLYPVDGESGGTWIGINNHGVLLCLLNHYPQGKAVAESASAQAGNWLSRGGIIPAALRAGVEEEVEQHLQHLQPESFQGFDLFLISARSHLHFVWNGSCFSQSTMNIAPWFMFTSSSYHSEAIQRYRKDLFCEWLGSTLCKEQPDQVLSAFHLVQDAQHKAASVLMERKHSHTKSVVQVKVEQRAATMHYYPDVCNGVERHLQASV